jgi:heme/copper-type cytochrome/quinol oxidase subunit 3
MADDTRSPLQDAGAMGMYLLIAALGMLFAGSVVGYLAIRSAHQPWPPPGFPVLPRSLWLSTLCILLCSVTIQRALRAVRGGEKRDRSNLCAAPEGPFRQIGPVPFFARALRRNLTFTLALGVAFLALQTFAWWQVVRQIQQPSENLGPYLKLFYVLTGLHAAHVLGGLGTLAVVTRRAWAGRYSPTYYPGVRYSAIYWHFLDAVWCVLFVVVYLM